MVRIKERYLLVNILYPNDSAQPPKSGLPSHVQLHQPTTDTMTPGSLLRGIKKEVEILYGDCGAGMLNGLQIKYLSLATSTFIIKCSRAMCSMLWSALTFMGRVPNKDGTGKQCIFRVVRVSGTIRKVEEEAIRQSRALIVAAKQEASEAQSSISGITRQTAGMQAPVQSHFATVDDSDESMDDADG